MSHAASHDAFPGRLRWLSACALILGLPVLAGAVVGIAVDAPARGQAVAALVFLALAILAELKPVPLEEEGLSSVSLAFVFILASLILFGWEYGVLIAAISAFATQTAEKRPLGRTAFNTVVYALSALAAAVPAFLLGEGVAGDPLAVTVYALWGGAAFATVNGIFMSLAISFHSGARLRRLLNRSFKLAAPAFALQAFLAALAAGLWASDPQLLVLMAGPLFTVTLYQRSALASRIATRDAHTDSLTRFGNSRSYELGLPAAMESAAATGGPLSLCVLDVDDFKQINDIYGHQVGDQVLVEVAKLLSPDDDKIRAFRLGGDEFALLIPCDQDETRRHLDVIYRRMSAAVYPHGEPVTISVGVALYPDHTTDPEVLEHMADGALYRAKHKGKNGWCIYSRDVAGVHSSQELERRAEHHARLRAAENLIRVVDAKDTYTGAHSERVALFVEGIARKLELEEELVEELKLAGRLHDLGKIAIADRVLQKPGRLNLEEERHIEAHPELGASLLDGMDIRPVDVWIRHHHEHWDGSGYPDRLAGEQIPFGSRVILVADAYDAMTTNRSYRAAMTPAEALLELRRMSGVQFDPAIVSALEAHLEEVEILTAPPAERVNWLARLVA
jgi:diguanylate cyclase (GGDEF)-like protein